MSHPTSRPLAVLGALAALGLLSSCSLLGNDAPRDESGQVTESADAGAMSIRLGDCISDVSALQGEVDTVPVTPCENPHQGEVYSEKKLDGDKLPKDVSTQADEFCMGGIIDFLGGDPSPDYSDLSVMYLHPTEQTWLLGDRLIQCIVYSEAGGLTGSLKGIAAS